MFFLRQGKGMAERTLSNSRIRMQVGKTPLSVASLRNLLTGVTICKGGTQSILVRTPRAVSDPVFLTEIESSEPAAGRLCVNLRDQSGKYRARLELSPSTDGIAFHLALSAPEPVWVVEYQLRGIELDEVIFPALGGQSLTRAMPPETAVTYKYPFWLNAQFVLGITQGGGIWLRSKDIRPVFKFIRVKRSADKFDISYGMEADGPLKSKSLEATWFLDCFEGSWKVPVDMHRKWLEEVFALVPFRDNPSLPTWARDINFVLTLWGIGKDSPEPYHTFEQMIRRLQQWARIHEPSRTLVYLAGFAQHGIDSRAPDYAPSPQLGGSEQFKNLVSSAHQLGYHVMVHTNALCMTFNHPQFWRFEHLQVVDVFGRHQGWGLDIDGDWLAEPFFAYINPGAKEWGELMERVIGELIRSYGVDAVFLDQTLFAFNVSRGPNFVIGMREYIQRLKTAFPGTLFAGEGLHEQVASVLPFAQIHGIDSIAEVHSMDVRARWRKAHPVSTYLFGKYTRFTAHLLRRHPSHPMFVLQESAYAKLGVIPSLCLYANEQPMDSPEVRKMIRRAKRLQGAR